MSAIFTRTRKAEKLRCRRTVALVRVDHRLVLGGFIAPSLVHRRSVTWIMLLADFIREDHVKPGHERGGKPTLQRVSLVSVA
jgi:hypothetical protein